MFNRIKDWFKPVLLRSELISSNEQEVICWIEVADGLRIKVNLPPHSIDHLGLSEGDEFMWGLYRKRAFPVTETAKERTEHERIRQELEQLNNEI